MTATVLTTRSNAPCSIRWTISMMGCMSLGYILGVSKQNATTAASSWGNRLNEGLVPPVVDTLRVGRRTALPSNEFTLPDSDDDNNNSPLDSSRENDSGWKTVHLFYGNDKHLPGKDSAKFSQANQDKLIQTLLNNQHGGFYLDLAANDATSLSNTYRLERDNNWTGLCVEPNPRYWRGLSYRKCHVVGAVVAGKERMQEVSFRFHDGTGRGPGGGIEGDAFDNKPSRPKTNSPPTRLFTVPLSEVLNKFQAPSVIDYLSLDIEGAETTVMRDFPFDQYQFRVMTVERPDQELVQLLYDHNYRYLAAFEAWGDETLWAHSSALPSLNLTAIPASGWTRQSTRWMQVPDRQSVDSTTDDRGISRIPPTVLHTKRHLRRT